jgi:hypothetical protein
MNSKSKIIEGFSLGDIGRAFDSIGNLFNQIGDAFNQIANIQKLIECPINLMKNLPTCVYYYSIDTFVIILYYIVYWILYIFLYIPIFIAFTIVRMTFLSIYSIGLGFIYENSLWGKYDFLNQLNITPEDICSPSLKYDIAYCLEYLYRITSGDLNLINRTSSDIDNCYCNKIQNVFNPLTDFNTPNINNPDSGYKEVYLVISFFILGFLYVCQYSKWGIKIPFSEKKEENKLF